MCGIFFCICEDGVDYEKDISNCHELLSARGPDHVSSEKMRVSGSEMEKRFGNFKFIISFA